jgi:hypothetical protein
MNDDEDAIESWAIELIKTFLFAEQELILFLSATRMCLCYVSILVAVRDVFFKNRNKKTFLFLFMSRFLFTVRDGLTAIAIPAEEYHVPRTAPWYKYLYFIYSCFHAHSSVWQMTAGWYSLRQYHAWHVHLRVPKLSTIVDTRIFSHMYWKNFRIPKCSSGFLKFCSGLLI